MAQVYLGQVYLGMPSLRVKRQIDGKTEEDPKEEEEDPKEEEEDPKEEGEDPKEEGEEAEEDSEEKKILHFTALEDEEAHISLNTSSSSSIKLEYKINNGEWSRWRLRDMSLQKDDVMYVRAVDENKIFSEDQLHSCWFSMSGGKVAAGGSIQYLLKKDGDIDSVPEYAFNGLFSGCSNLTQAPELPATTLASYCYYCMFNNCTSLTQAPELPATTLADSCYYQMFANCSSLTQAPALPATTLADSCYRNMLRNTSLTQAPELPATTLASSCYSYMFGGCSSLTQAPALPATTLANSCYDHMFFYAFNISEVHMPASMNGVYNTSIHGDIEKTVIYDL